MARSWIIKMSMRELGKFIMDPETGSVHSYETVREARESLSKYPL